MRHSLNIVAIIFTKKNFKKIKTKQQTNKQNIGTCWRTFVEYWNRFFFCFRWEYHLHQIDMVSCSVSYYKIKFKKNNVNKHIWRERTKYNGRLDSKVKTAVYFLFSLWFQSFHLSIVLLLLCSIFCCDKEKRQFIQTIKVSKTTLL